MKIFLTIVMAATLITSCTINKNIMFKTDTEYVFDNPFTDSTNTEYRLAPNDIIAFQLFTNEGAMILEFTAGSAQTPRYFNFRDFTYQIDANGYADLPALGRFYLAGYTVKQAQDSLEVHYVDQFNKPMAVVQVVNHRVIVFPGTGGTARVVPLLNQNTSVLEALAQAGGIDDRGNASKVKLIRRTPHGDEVYLMNLSVIEGLPYGQMTVQAGDVIYVEPVPEIAAEALKDISPYVSIISGLALIYAIVVKGF